MRDPSRRVRFGVLLLALIVVAGSIGYHYLGLGDFGAFYQTIVTITTVGFGPPHGFSTAAKVFTIALILFGVGTALYTFTVVLEVLIEGHMREVVRRRRMNRQINRMKEHVILCGWGRVGRQVARFLANSGKDLVVIDRDAERLETVPHPTVQGDVTDDATLIEAGIERAAALVAALDTDADNLYLTVAGRSLRPDLHIIARARSDSSEAKLFRASANRVVNPQRLGGDRMGAFVVQPHVVDFLDIVMHDGSLEFRLEDITVREGSRLCGESLSSARIHEQTGALILAIRRADGSFTTNPPPTVRISSGDVLIGVGTEDQLHDLSLFAAGEAGDQ